MVSAAAVTAAADAADRVGKLIVDWSSTIGGMVADDRVARENFARDMAEKVFNEGNGAFSCVIVAVDGFLNGSEKDYVRTRATALKYRGGGHQMYTIFMVPTGVKVNFIRRGDGGYLNWAIHGYFDRGQKEHEAHVWIPNWKCEPWL